MASFTEQATLKVNDQSSAAIRKINAELKKLERTAKSLKSITVDLKVNTSGLQAANRQLNALARNMSIMRGQTLNLRVNTAGLTQAQSNMARLRQQAARPITVNTQAGGGGGGRGGGGRGRGRGGVNPGAGPSARYQYGNFPILRGAASVVIGGTAYAVAANVARTAVKGVMGTEDARMRLRQSGFDKGRKDDLTPQTDYIMAMARKAQEEFNRIPAAAIADASVEQLNAIKANKGTSEDMQNAMRRVARNAQIMGTTFKDAGEGAEASRQLERLTQALGYDVEKPTGPEAGKLQAIQEEAMRAVISTGGEIKAEEMVRVIQQLGPAVAKAMSPASLGDIMQIREEGGKASTAEWRITMQNLMRDDLNKRDKASMARHGLRLKSGAMDPRIVNAAGDNLIDFTIDKIKPIIDKAGLAAASSAEIAAYLDKEVGFTTAGARGIADIITSWRSGDIQRQRAQRAAVDLDPHLGDKTFRGGAERMSASFQTAMGRALDKSGGAFSEAIAPFSVAMDKAGKAAEKGNYTEAAAEMTAGVAKMMGGPAGAIVTAMTAASAVQTLLDPRSTPMEKGAAMLVTGSSALLTAAGYLSNLFGGGDPNKDVAELEKQQKEGPDRLARLKAEEAKEAGLDKKDKTRLMGLRAAIEAEERTQRVLPEYIERAKVKAAVANQQAADAKVEEAAAMEELRRKAGFDGDGTAAAAATAPKSAISDATVQQLRQLSAGGKLDGVKSVTDLLKVLNQPTSVKSREDLARQFGYTGPGGGSADMNAYLLKFLKWLAAMPEPPKVEPPKVEPPKVEPPAEPPKVEPPAEPPKVPPPSATPTIPLPALPTVPGFTPISFTTVVDPSTIPGAFDSTFSAGATTLGRSGTTVGSNAADSLAGRAGGIGASIGDAAAARISQATVNFNIPNMPSPKAPTGESRA
jgi:hypothetical protein